MSIKFKWRSVVLLAALALLGCKDDETEKRLATNFQQLDFPYTGLSQPLLIRSTVPWTLECRYESGGEGWLSFDKQSGPGDAGVVSQRVEITAPYNGNPERRAVVHILGAGFDRKVEIVQEEGLVKIGEVTVCGDRLVKGEPVTGTYLAVPYSRTHGDEKMGVECTVTGTGAAGISLKKLADMTLKPDAGVVYVPVEGTPADAGEAVFSVRVRIGENDYGPFEVKNEVSGMSRMAVPADLSVYKSNSHELVLKWYNDRSVVRAKKWMWQLLAADSPTAEVVREFEYEVSKGEDGNKKYPYNRFVIGGLKPATTYYFRVKRGVSVSEADDDGKIESKWSALCAATTLSEPEVPADAVLFQDFRGLTYGGNNVYTAWGAVPQPENGTTLPGASYAAHKTANSPAGNLFTTYSEAYRAAVGLEGWVGGNNAAGHTGNNSVYGATGMLKMGTGSIAGWIQTPKLAALTEATDVVVKFEACCWWEDISSPVPSDNPQMTLKVIGPGTVADGTREQTLSINPKSEMGSYEIRVDGATSETQIEFIAARAATNRWFLDNIVIVPVK